MALCLQLNTLKMKTDLEKIIFTPIVDWTQIYVDAGTDSDATQTVCRTNTYLFDLHGMIKSKKLKKKVINSFLDSQKNLKKGMPLIYCPLTQPLGNPRMPNHWGYEENISDAMRPYIYARLGRRMSLVLKDIKTHKKLHEFLINNFVELLELQKINYFVALTAEEHTRLKVIADSIEENTESMPDNLVEFFNSIALKFRAKEIISNNEYENHSRSQYSTEDEDENEDEYEDDEG